MLLPISSPKNNSFHEKPYLFILLQARQNATHVIANLQRQRVDAQLIAAVYLENNIDLMDVLISG